MTRSQATRACWALPLLFAPDLSTDGAHAAAADGDPASVIVVTARRYPPRCAPRPGDPADALAARPGIGEQSVVAVDAAGAAVLVKDREQLTGPGHWQRVGNAVGDYVFRVPADGSPMCIGARIPHPNGWGQLRQIVDVHPYFGSYVRFTAWVATRKAAEVRFWLIAAAKPYGMGGDTSAAPVRGSHRWMPVSLTIGPVPTYTTHLSYGFLLYGSGDVWLYRPELRVVPADDAQLKAHRSQAGGPILRPGTHRLPGG